MSHMQNVLGICGVMASWSWVHVDLALVLTEMYQMVTGVCQAYITHVCWAYVCGTCIVTV